MLSNSNIKSSYKLSFKLLSIIILCSVSFLFVFSSCSQQEPEEKIDVGTEATSPENETKTSEPEVENTTETEEEEVEEEPEETEEALTEEEEETEEPKEPEDITIRVYYADSTVQFLVGEERIITSNHKYLSAFMELLKHPLEPGHIMLVPENTKINKISFNDGNILLDLSKEFVEERFKSDAVDVLLVYSIVNTFTEFAEVNTVTFYIDGQKLDTLGQLDVSNSLYRDSSWIKAN